MFGDQARLCKSAVGPVPPLPLSLSHTQRLVNGWLTGRLLAELLVLVESFSSTFTPMNPEPLMCFWLIYSGTSYAMLQLLHFIQTRGEKNKKKCDDLTLIFSFFFYQHCFLCADSQSSLSRSWKVKKLENEPSEALKLIPRICLHRQPGSGERPSDDSMIKTKNDAGDALTRTHAHTFINKRHTTRQETSN